MIGLNYATIKSGPAYMAQCSSSADKGAPLVALVGKVDVMWLLALTVVLVPYRSVNRWFLPGKQNTAVSSVKHLHDHRPPCCGFKCIDMVVLVEKIDVTWVQFFLYRTGV